jgi:hypothetical protein
MAPTMEAARTFETLVNFYQTTRCYNPEDKTSSYSPPWEPQILLNNILLYNFSSYVPLKSYLLLFKNNHHHHQLLRIRPCGLFQFWITSEIMNQFRHLVWLLGRVISPSQGLYLHRIAKHRKAGFEPAIPVSKRPSPTLWTARPLRSGPKNNIRHKYMWLFPCRYMLIFTHTLINEHDR